ncbi:hypothetical protein ESCAB7627_2589 [Escherichia albertii TW07627]|uniref:Uncharacterized protein n=1 Tax=Escherichia albertii (strain TW07627) TaxID=502347 RepID=A0ABC9NP62_ESCAT|nr:hypothetical protein ESCAB7627_2589 [Escherichia albertii TW07627]OSL32442.1 hypothetical protein EAPG_01094 [Escherichia albertii B156]
MHSTRGNKKLTGAITPLSGFFTQVLPKQIVKINFSML